MPKRYPVQPPVPINDVYTQTCRHCGGGGQEPGLPDLTCRECAGRGNRRWRIRECEQCGGSGRRTLGLLKCPECKGRGWVALSR